jgi:hypothetical protein
VNPYDKIMNIASKYIDTTKKTKYEDLISFIYNNINKEQWHNFFEDMKKEGLITNDK